MNRVFSSRLQWDALPNPLTALLAEKRRQGAPVLDLTESNPTRAALHYPGELMQALADPRALRYDPDPRGMLAAREAVSRYYAQRGVEVNSSRVLLTASTSEAYTYLFKLLTDPGDEVLVPRPSYPLFEYLAAMESVRVRQYPLRYDGAWHVDFTALEAMLTPRTRAIVVVNPNNPTGSYLKNDERERLERLNLPILSDEVFSDFNFGPDSRRVASLAGPANVLTFSMSGLSKIAGLPQMKLGWIVASGPRHEEALDGLEWIADTFLSVATPVQVALPRLMEASSAIRDQIHERALANLAFLREALHSESVGHEATQGGSPAHLLRSEGGWYAVLQVPRARSEEDWTLRLLAEHNVLVQPGFFYDFEAEAYLVLSLLTVPEVFRAGIDRVLAALVQS